jgi:lysophospholipase L1-like esterase
MLAATVFTLILMEIALGILGIPRYSTPAHHYRSSDEILHHKLIPGTSGRLVSSEFDILYEINSIGLRDIEIADTGSYRILMLGDSYTEGVGVQLNETIPKRLESMLADAGHDVQVINGGVSSYSPTIEYIYLKTQGLSLKPDMVILNLDLTDFRDDYMYQKIALSNGSEITAVPGSRTDSRTWRGNIEYICMEHRLNLCLLLGRSFYRLTNLDLQEIDFTEGDIETDPWFMTRPGATNKDYSATFSQIKAISELCDRNGIEFILVSYPHGHQVSGKEWQQGRVKWKLDDKKVYSKEIFDDVAMFANRENILYISTDYKFNTLEYPLYYSLDNHMTEKGYRLVAEGIFENVLKLGLIR